MQIVSGEFAKAMGSHPYIARITLDGTDVIQSPTVQEIFFRGGANSSEDTILLGSAFAASAEITLDRDTVSCAIEGRELFVELGIELTNGVEWLPMGRYTAQDPSEADGVLTVIAMDALGAKFNVDYEPLEGFDFTAEGGVPSTEFLSTLCERRGVPVDLAGLAPIALQGAPDGFTERQIIGFISALYGGFANVDRHGVLRIRRYTAVDAAVSPENYYEDGLQKATYSFTPGWLKCYNEAAGLTMFVGDMDADQGINLESIWMNQAILNGLWEQLMGFTYRPVPELSFLGNPLIDPGDILTLEDTAGELAAVPVMTVTHEYDGGIKTTISACGQAKTTDYQGPTRRAVFRSAESAKMAAKEYADEENAKLNQEELLKRLTNAWADDGIYLTEDGKLAVKATAIGVGVITSADGTVQIDLDNNKVTIDTSTADRKSKLELTSSGLAGYGWNYETGEYYPTLRLGAGAKTSAGAESYTQLTSRSSGAGLAIAAALAGAALLLGSYGGQNETRIQGDPITIGRGQYPVNINGAVAIGAAADASVAIRPGKTVLCQGLWERGETLEVPNTANYDLFGVKLYGTDGDANAMVLAYKFGDKICGVGGWSGTASAAKQLYFFSASFSGDTWIFEDAGVHVVNFAGGIEAGTKLHLRQVIGII